ncbi:MAG: MerR family DNA-binding protein [Caldilineaceae bacterium]
MGRSTSKAEVRACAKNKVAQIDAKVAALQQMRDALSHLIDQCQGDGPTDDCPILEAMELHTFRNADE